MQPRRLGTVVALGFGLLAIAPDRIFAFTPNWFKEASSTSHTAAHELGEEAQGPPLEYPFLPGAVPTVVDSSHEGYSTHQAGMPPYQHHHPGPAQHTAQSDPPLEYPFLPGADRTVVDSSHEGYSTHQAGMPPYQHNPLLNPAQHTAQHYTPIEYNFMPDAGTTQGDNPYQISYATQHQPDLIDWRRDPQYAAQHHAEGQGYPPYPGVQALYPYSYAANPVQYAAQHPAEGQGYPPYPGVQALYLYSYAANPVQHAAPQYHAEGQGYPPYPGVQALDPYSYAANPVQHAAPQYHAEGQTFPSYPGAQAWNPDSYAATQQPGLAKRKKGRKPRASPFGQTQGDDAASTLYPSGASGREGGSSPPSGWPDYGAQHGLPAPSTGQILSQDYRKNYPPPDFIANWQKSAKKADPTGIFTLAHIGKNPYAIPQTSLGWFIADQGQRDIITKLLNERFKPANVEIYMPEETPREATLAYHGFEPNCQALLDEPENCAWEFTGHNGGSFFFDVGEFRIRCAPIPSGQHVSKVPGVVNLKVVGAHRVRTYPQPLLFIGVAKLPAATLDEEKNASMQRLYQYKKDVKLHSLGVDKSVGGTGRQQEQQEGSSGSSRARKGKQQQQPEQQQHLEQQQQLEQQQAINMDRRRARKGKQQQQPM